MKPTPACILYSNDKTVSNRLVRIAAQSITLQVIETEPDLEQWFAQFGHAVLLADLRAPNCFEVLSVIKKEHPLTVIVVMGVERSDPMLNAGMLEPFAAVPLDVDLQAFQALLNQAIECYCLRHSNHILSEELLMLKVRTTESGSPPTRMQPSGSLQHFSKAQRNVDNLEELFDGVVEGLVATARVSRTGIFIRNDHENTFSFQAGTRCLPTTEGYCIGTDAPFIRWMELNTHLISRAMLQRIAEPDTRAMLKQVLDALGAEIIVPLYTTEGIKGWIFIGPRSSGLPFEEADLEELTTLADHISTTIEKALKYQETALQKALAETLLHSIPFGIIACDDSAVVRWFNSTGNEILQSGEENPIGLRVEQLGSQIADLFHRTIDSEELPDAYEWTDIRTKRTLSAETRRLHAKGKFIGVMMMLRDISGAKLLQEKTDQLERAAFWNELASSMSHEIRNPLVAIKTFAQLLPDRYEEADFRAEFSQQVTAEVDQLNHIIDKINEFANPPKPTYQPLDVHKPIEFAVTRVQSEFNHENLKIHLSSDESDLLINGDAASLEECFYHLLRNAAENLDNKPGSRISVVVKGRMALNGDGHIYVMITDNGSGIDPALRDKIYSPFSTIKARGLGLGLPIAKRSVIDHNGQIDIDTSEAGTTVSIAIPAIDAEIG
jgi:nitrogen-specific signal transduction histidine kinase